jgi:hypothetical protein
MRILPASITVLAAEAPIPTEVDVRANGFHPPRSARLFRFHGSGGDGTGVKISLSIGSVLIDDRCYNHLVIAEYRPLSDR